MAKRKKVTNKTTRKAAKKTAKKKNSTQRKVTKKKVAKKVAKKATKKSSAKQVSKKKVAKKAKKKVSKKKVAKKKATKKTVAKKKAAKKKRASKKSATSKKTSKKSVSKTSVKNKASKKATKSKAVKKMSETELVTYSSQVSEGSPVPTFTADMTGDQAFDLSNYSGKKVVLYFYPKDSTPGCTVEGHDFTELHGQFKHLGAEVFGISRDSLKSHENFKSKQNYSFELISDPEEKVCAIFGTIKLKNMYGKKVRGIDRSTFVIDGDGTLLKEWRGVKVPDHAKEVLEFLKG